MIIESLKLKSYLDLILHLDLDLDSCFPSLNLEISNSISENDINYLTIAANYSDDYYISINILNESNEYELNDCLIIPKEGVIKLYQLTTLWPKSSVKITNVNNLILLEVVSHGNLVRERPVYIECLFNPAINEYIIEPPSMNYNCIANTKNLKQMIEFCSGIKEGIIIEIRNKNLSISSSDLSIATLVELEEIVENPCNKIKLSAEAIKLIISFLNKLINKFNLVYLLFIEKDKAFSIKIKFDDNTIIQIFTIHD